MPDILLALECVRSTNRTVRKLEKALITQTKINKHVRLFIFASMMYMAFSELRSQEQAKQIAELNEKLEELRQTKEE